MEETKLFSEQFIEEVLKKAVDVKESIIKEYADIIS